MHFLTARNLLTIALTGLIVGCVAMILFLSYRQIAKALTPKPETFTELYFEDHTNLPITLLPGAPVSFSFTIHNVEGQQMQYPVEVTAQYGEGPTFTQDILSSTIILDAGKQQTIPVAFNLYDVEAGKANVVVKLINKDQTIHFAINIAPRVIPSPVIVPN